MSNSNQELPFTYDELNDTSPDGVMTASEILKSFGPDGPSPDSPVESTDPLTDIDILKFATDANELEKITISSRYEAIILERKTSINDLTDHFQKYFKNELSLLLQLILKKCFNT